MASNIWSGVSDLAEQYDGKPPLLTSVRTMLLISKEQLFKVHVGEEYTTQIYSSMKISDDACIL